MPSATAAVSGGASLDVFDRTRHRAHRNRALLGVATVVGVGVAAGLAAASPAGRVDPDLARLLRFMAVLKGVFALVALGVCAWRLARPAAAWREAVYIGGPGLMSAGAVCLWQMQGAGIAAVGLHAGMFALLAAALTDAAFIPALGRRQG